MTGIDLSNALHPLDDETTLLRYAIQPDPNPLQVGAAGRLTLVVRNRGTAFVQCSKIVITLPVGTTARALTPDGSAIESARPANWNVQNENGELTCTPATSEAGRIGGDGLTFIFSRFTVNNQVGPCTIGIDETAATTGAPERRSTDIELAKFPLQFTLSELKADDQTVRFGGSTILRWSGSAVTGAIYTLRYQAEDGGPWTTATLGNTGPYTATNLRRAGSVFFTLIVSVPVAGQDQPMIVQRQAQVAVENLMLSLSVFPPKVGVNGLVLLQWRSAYARSCVLDPGGETLPTSGWKYVTISQTTIFTITARSALDVQQQQKTVEVDPKIIPNVPGQNVIGSDGGPGSNGVAYFGSDFSWHPGDGGGGGRGGDAKLELKLPPLDESAQPQRVMALTLKGGRGGPGGNGSPQQFDTRYPIVPGGNGGNGGAGGDALLDVTFDPSAGPPTQYIVQTIAGAGGDGGKSGDIVSVGPWGPTDGHPGPFGRAAFTFRSAPQFREADTRVGAQVEEPPLLAYALLTTPSPLQASSAGQITVVVSNQKRADVTCKRIVITLPVGTEAKALTTDATSVESARPANWSVQSDNGVFTCTPNTPADGVINTQGLSFTFSRFTVNGEPGTCRIGIDETASTAAQAETLRSLDIPVAKFPRQFALGELTADPVDDIPTGGSTTLMWTGTQVVGATYSLRYQPRDQGTPVNVAVGNVGPYTARDLARSGSVTFTLTVTLPVPGQDTPLIVQKQTTVTIATLSVSMSVLPTSVGENGLALVRWEALNAASCMLDPGGETIPTYGSRYMIIPQTTSITITARNAAGGIKQEQRTVNVDRSIQPNVSGKSVIGADGGPGRDGGIPHSMNGGPGGEGGDATFTGTLPPLDTSSRPARVMPITVTGGAGGKGGNGIPRNEHGLSGAGGDGGRGGDVKLDATLDPSAGAPVQYVVQLRGGKGGDGGTGTHPGFHDGQRGRDGVATFKVK